MALANRAADNVPDPGLDQDRFCALWERAAARPCTQHAAAVFEKLQAHYREPQRHYHTPEHIRHCLVQFDLACTHMCEPDAVELALWFHDVIYDTRGTDNEIRSATWFASVTDNVLPDKVRRRVHELIMVTVHPSQPAELDQQFVVDIDLSSFALPWNRFKRDSQAVRREMGHLSDRDFFSGQIRFLRTLLSRPAFFITPFFHQRSEAAARENVTRYLRELRERGFSA